jgi:hypothetical protein
MLIQSVDTFVEQIIGHAWRGYLSQAGSASGNVINAYSGTNITSPGAVNIGTGSYIAEQTRTRFTSATTANAATGRSGTYDFMATSSSGGRGGGAFAIKFGITTLPTAPRLAIGCSNHPGGATEPSAVTAHLVWIGFDSTDANMQWIVNNNSGGGTKTNTGIAIATTGWYHAAAWNVPGSLEWNLLLVREDNGQIFFVKTSTDVPTSGQSFPFGIRAMITATTGTAIVLDLGHFMLRGGRT